MTYFEMLDGFSFGCLASAATILGAVDTETLTAFGAAGVAPSVAILLLRAQLVQSAEDRRKLLEFYEQNAKRNEEFGRIVALNTEALNRKADLEAELIVVLRDNTSAVRKSNQ